MYPGIVQGRGEGFDIEGQNFERRAKSSMGDHGKRRRKQMNRPIETNNN